MKIKVKYCILGVPGLYEKEVNIQPPMHYSNPLEAWERHVESIQLRQLKEKL